MKFKLDKRYMQIGVLIFTVIAASMLFYYGVFHMSSIRNGIGIFLKIIAPIVYGVVIAYMLSSFVNFLEQRIVFPAIVKSGKVVTAKKKKVVRWISVLFSIILLYFIIYAIAMLILPQLIRSIMSVINNFPTYMNVLQKWLTSLADRYDGRISDETVDVITEYSNNAQAYLTNNILPQMREMLANITTSIFDILVFLKNFVVGSIIAVYVVVDKEVFTAKGKMIAYAVFPKEKVNNLIKSMRFTDRVFSGFLTGKLLDSAIIGILCYIGMSILNLPYSLLISVIIGVTNIIPYFGPFFGAIPSALLILFVSPIQALYFLIFILILQQFDGNVLGPKIIGDSTGLSSFMVIVAIIVGGGLFGVVGMLIGVPVCAVIYTLIWTGIKKQLHDKEMPDEMEEYYKVGYYDIEKECFTPAPQNESKPSRISPDTKTNLLKFLEFIQKAIKISTEKLIKKHNDFRKLKEEKGWKNIFIDFFKGLKKNSHRFLQNILKFFKFLFLTFIKILALRPKKKTESDIAVDDTEVVSENEHSEDSETNS